MSGVTIVEVGPRDGLQAMPARIPTHGKIALVDALSAAGLPRIEAASFVSPKAVPQMADSAAVMAGITRRSGTRYAALVPNLEGYRAARAAGADEVAIFASASESFSCRNVRASIAESLERFAAVAEAAAADAVPMRAYLSCAVHCPYEGWIQPHVVARLAGALSELGAREIALADTTGQATPAHIAAMLDAVLDLLAPDCLAGHFHDTNGQALESVRVALGHGVTVFDASVGGLGGCPFAPGARGNLATERLVEALEADGIATGVDRAALARARRFALGLSERVS